MNDTLPQDHTPAQDWQTRAKQIFEPLSPFGRVCLNADLSRNRVPRYAEGMTLKDVVLLTGLPEQEAANRMKEHKRDGNPDLYAVLRLSMEAGKQYTQTPPTPKPAEVVQLHFWGEDYRAAPNAVFRTALFPATNPKQKEKRPFLKNEDIYCVAGIKIFFTGEQFDQSDLDVYLEILNMAQPFPLGTPVTFSAHALLKALGLPTGGSNHARLHEVLIRLCGGVVDATDHGKRYFGQLLHGGIRDEITQNYTIKINPDFAVLFGFGMFAKIDLATRRALGRNNTAKALQAYYSTHLTPGFHNIETLCNLTGLKGINRKRDILKAHASLAVVGFCEGYELNEDRTGIRLVNMNQHTSQTRALAKNATKATKTSPRRRNAPTLAGDLLAGLHPIKK